MRQSGEAGCFVAVDDRPCATPPHVTASGRLSVYPSGEASLDPVGLPGVLRRCGVGPVGRPRSFCVVGLDQINNKSSSIKEARVDKDVLG